MKKKRKYSKYIDYDYEKAYMTQLKNLEDYFVESMLATKGRIKCAYMTKEITAGEQFEIELYPQFTQKRKDMIPEEAREPKKDNTSQRNLNDKNARKYLIRLINTNFAKNDIWITLTYLDSELPKSMKEAEKNVKNYIRRMNTYRKKLGLPNTKYIYITEWEQEKENKIRCHHHVILDGLLDMDTVEKKWIKGERNECRRLEPDEQGLTGMATYITKDPRGKKRWIPSVGLKKPQIERNHKFKRTKVEDMVRNQNTIKEQMETEYKDYTFTDCEVYFNDFNALFYIHVNMRKKNVDNVDNHRKKLSHTVNTKWERKT